MKVAERLSQGNISAQLHARTGVVYKLQAQGGYLDGIDCYLNQQPNKQATSQIDRPCPFVLGQWRGQGTGGRRVEDSETPWGPRKQTHGQGKSKGEFLPCKNRSSFQEWRMEV